MLRVRQFGNAEITKQQNPEGEGKTDISPSEKKVDRLELLKIDTAQVMVLIHR